MKVFPTTRKGWIRLGLAAGLIVMCAGGCSMFGISMPGRSYRGALPPLTAAETTTSAGLRRHVTRLATDIGERHTDRYEALTAAVAYIETEFRAQGLEPVGQDFEAGGRTVRNIEGVLPGGRLSNETVVVGGHYDTAFGTPGANDNASGVAATLELARLLKGRRLDRTVKLVAFVNEEPPYFWTSKMGSRVYAKAAAARGEKIVGMLSLETMGCFTDAPGTQHYPWPLSRFYPDTGNFIGFVGNLGSRRLVRQCVGAFRETAQFPSEGAALFGWLQGIGWSDHSSFWLHGYPALMVTDTAFFRYAPYHTPGDTAEKVDYDRMARVAAGLVPVIERLANE